jgi:AcrR family transcriptional regulator
MVKPTDLQKLYEVREAAIKVIVERGYYGATIAQISKRAGVSDGYIYRHYSGKAELVRELFVESMGYFHAVVLEALAKEKKLDAILFSTFNFLRQSLIEDSDTIAFIFIMDHDHSFDFPDEVRQGFREIGSKLKALGYSTGEISKSLNEEDIIAIVFGLPIKYMEMRRKNIVSNKAFTETDMNLIVKICKNALKS